jgi:hypothetical protein
VQLGWFGGFMGVRVRHQAPDSQALAQTAERWRCAPQR